MTSRLTNTTFVCLCTMTLFLFCLGAAAHANNTGTYSGGSISGKVLDGFNEPVSGVEVDVIGTQYSCVTGDDGSYRISYDPGITKLSFTKPGYTKSVTTLNTPEITDVDLKTVTLWRYPKSGGMHFMGDKGYTPVSHTSFAAERVSSGLRFSVNGEPIVIDSRRVLMLDYDKHRPVLGGKNLYVVYDNNLLGYLGASEFPIKMVKDKYIKIAKNMGIRMATLEPGKYFYYIGFINNRTRKGEGVFFEIRPLEE